jgi:hypothetical protein
MRILTLIYEFPPVGGGGGRAAYDICKHLAAQGNQVVVITAHMQGLAFEERLDGIQLTRNSPRRVESICILWICATITLSIRSKCLVIQNAHGGISSTLRAT